MTVHHLQRGQLVRPIPRRAQATRILAPIKGVDVRSATALTEPGSAIFLRNLVPTQNGCELRQGYREWQIGLEDTASLGVRTIIPFASVTALDADDRLFAVTNEGIWDVTTDKGTPILKLSFSVTDKGAGYGSYTQYANDAGEDQLFYADMENGLFSYDKDTDSWAQTTGLTGLDAEEVSYVTTHKQRLWLAQRNSTVGWYLPIGAVTGDVTPFYFGPKFTRGGQLAGFANWSVDSGDGLDEFFVAVSRAGTVLVYQGDNPSDATSWSLRGAYEIGDLPAGVQFNTRNGRDIYLLSSFGVITMNDLLSGVTLRGDQPNQITGKISALIQDAMNRTRTEFGWSVQSIPDESQLIITVPDGTFFGGSAINVQFVYSYPTAGWAVWRDVPIQCANHWKGRVVGGGKDSRVVYMDSLADDVRIADPPEGEQNGKPIDWSVTSNFSLLDDRAAAQYKRIKYMRPDFNSLYPPTFEMDAIFDFESRNISAVSNQLELPGVGGLWDIALWDEVFWSTSTRKGYSGVMGDFGTGRYVAIAMRGYAYPPLLFLGWDVIYDLGGVLL